MKTITTLLLSLLFCLSLAAFAKADDDQPTLGNETAKEQTDQASSNKDEEAEEEDDTYWEVEVGFIVGIGRSAHDWENQSRHGNIINAPWLAGGYYNGDFFVESNPAAGKLITAGYTVHEDDQWQVNLIATPFFIGFNEDSQQRGNLLNDVLERETSLDAGIEVMYSHKSGQFAMRALQDTIGAHNGYGVAFAYGFPVYLDKMAILPSINLTYISSKSNQYYYGIRPEEVNPDLPEYMPGSGLVTKFNLYLEYELSERTALIGFSHLTFTNDDIHRSPLVARNTSFAIGMGMIWIF